MLELKERCAVHAVLYEKNYPTLKEVEAAAAPAGCGPAAPTPRPIEELYKDAALMKKEPIPGRDERIMDFIDMACKASDEFMVSVKILLSEDRVQARYTLADGFGTLKFMSGLIDMADSASFVLEGEALVITLNFYTQATWLNGRRLLPQPWEI